MKKDPKLSALFLDFEKQLLLGTLGYYYEEQSDGLFKKVFDEYHPEQTLEYLQKEIDRLCIKN